MTELAKVERTTLTMKETAEYLGVSYWLVTQLVKRKQIPCSRVGGKVLFRKEALDNYLQKQDHRRYIYFLCNRRNNSDVKGLSDILQKNSQ